MKYFKLYALFTCLLISVDLLAGTGIFKGRVSDAVDHSPLIGAIVSVPELRISATTNANGEFTMKNLPDRGIFLVEVRYIGYKTVANKVDIATLATHNIELQRSSIEAQEVVVTGTASNSMNKKNSTSVAVLNKAELLRVPSTNIIDAIARIPGVSQVTTGSGISKPVIRGLGYNRVITLSDGVKQEGQQWGDEHGIEVDQFKADRVEVLRGAASLLYGSDAMGGVINILDPLVPANGAVKGEVVGTYATNNGLIGTSAMLEGNQNGFVWQARASYKNAYGYNTAAYRLPNSGFNESNQSAMLGLNKSWGYMHLNVSSFHQKLGLPEFGIDSLGRFVREPEDAADPAEVLDPSLYKTRKLLTPFQDIRHYKATLNNYFILPGGKLKAILAYQQNQRRELEDSYTDPNLFFDLKTYSYDLKYYFNEKNGWEPTIGLSGNFQNNKNKAAELLIPDYDSHELGLFAYVKKSWDKSTFNIGARYDYRNINAIQMVDSDGDSKFSNFSNNFSNVSGAAGFTHEINNNLTFKANLGSAFRAPNIAELSADGVHEGTSRYEIGNPDLKPERSIYADASLEYQTEHVNAFVNVYNNYINNYIYLKMEDPNEIQDGNHVYHYTQAKANLYGFEAGITLHPLASLHFENSFSMTRSRNTTEKSDLPFTPAPVLRNELRYEPGFQGVDDAWVSVGIDNFFKQTHVDQFETPSAGYTLLNASIGSSFMIAKQKVNLSISGNNLLNKKYIDHLSRFKLDGFYNPGRNVSFTLSVPLSIVRAN